MRPVRNASNRRCRTGCAPTAVTTRDARLSKPNRARHGLEALGVPATGGDLYQLALTHRSFAFEQPEPLPHNERLEFLGDAVLGLVATELIFDRYAEMSEGEMARLRAAVVNTIALADAARELGLGEHIRLGKGEDASGGRQKDSLLADTFEAIVGAVYVERGLEVIREALRGVLEPRIAAAQAGGRYDAKTALQEAAVRSLGDVPAYRVASSGPDHDKRFTAHVFVAETMWGAGSGRSKKEAEQNAARQALDHIEAGRSAPKEGADARAG